MKFNLTAKFLSGFMAASLLALGVHAYLRVRREQAYFDSHMRRHAAAFAASLAHGVAATDRAFGPETALLLVAEVNESSPQFRSRWVTLERDAGALPVPALPTGQLAELRRGSPGSLQIRSELPAPGNLATYVPVTGAHPERGRSAVEVVESLEEEHEFVRGTIRSTLLFSLTVLGLTSAVAAIMGVLFIGRPIRKLVQKAQRISAGDLAGPVVLRQRDELALLAGEMNAMCERLQEARTKVESETAARIAALEQMRHADRLVTIGRMASGIAHEVGTPLAVAGGRIGMVASAEVSGAEAIENARIAGEQLQRISAIIRQLLDFARRRPAQKGPVDLGALAARACGLLQPLAAKRGVALEVASDSGCAEPAEGDLGQLEQALTNLVVNGIQATPPGGRVAISCARGRTQAPAEAGGGQREFVCLHVIDTGAGMSAETQSHVFEPFFTTKAPGEGSGLGLAVTYGIVREHGGWLDVESEPGHGSRFTIYLPAPSGAAP